MGYTILFFNNNNSVMQLPINDQSLLTGLTANQKAEVNDYPIIIGLISGQHDFLGIFSFLDWSFCSYGNYSERWIKSSIVH